jgi:hypothetical protein
MPKVLVHQLCETEDEYCEAQLVQRPSGQPVKVAFAYLGHTGEERGEAGPGNEDIELQANRLPETRKGVVLLPGRWVVECTVSAGPIAFAGRLGRDPHAIPLAESLTSVTNPYGIRAKMIPANQYSYARPESRKK